MLAKIGLKNDYYKKKNDTVNCFATLYKNRNHYIFFLFLFSRSVMTD